MISALSPESDITQCGRRSSRRLGLLDLRSATNSPLPLCREHHHELHRHGNEMAWWANLQIAPLEVASELWTATLLQAGPARRTTEVANKRSGKIDPANAVRRTSP